MAVTDYRKIADMLIFPANLVLGPVAFYGGWNAYVSGQLLFAVAYILCGIVLLAYTIVLARQFVRGTADD